MLLPLAPRVGAPVGGAEGVEEGRGEVDREALPVALPPWLALALPEKEGEGEEEGVLPPPPPSREAEAALLAVPVAAQAGEPVGEALGDTLLLGLPEGLRLLPELRLADTLPLPLLLPEALPPLLRVAAAVRLAEGVRGLEGLAAPDLLAVSPGLVVGVAAAVLLAVGSPTLAVGVPPARVGEEERLPPKLGVAEGHPPGVPVGVLRTLGLVEGSGEVERVPAALEGEAEGLARGEAVADTVALPVPPPSTTRALTQHTLTLSPPALLRLLPSPSSAG